MGSSFEGAAKAAAAKANATKESNTCFMDFIRFIEAVERKISSFF